MSRSLVLALTLVGCTENTLVKTDPPIEDLEQGNGPDIEVDPSSVTFDPLAVGSEAAVQSVTVRNVGDEALTLNGLSIEDATAPYTLSALGSVLLEPGTETNFTIAFEPTTAAEWTTNVFIDSNDPDEARVAVPVTGTGIAPALQVTPENYDFGRLYVGCDSTAELTLTNVGNADLSITGFEYITASTEEFSFDDAEDVNGPLPWTLAPGTSTTVYVGYRPLDEYEDEGFVRIASNDPLRTTAMAYQSGHGEIFGENLDVFEQPIRGMTDIVFTLDWSCSMYDDIALVQSNFDVFVGTLVGMDADYQVAVVTADDGCVSGPVPFIDDEMSEDDQRTYFDQMVNGSYGAYTEMGFTLLEAAFTETNLGPGGCNESLIRDDATMALVGVTDEPEQSPNPWSYYVSLFQSMKASSDDVIMHAIAGDYPTGCGSAMAGTGWYEATVATGGLFLSICATDWASHLEALAEGSAADLTSFELTDWPVPETIRVSVDGVPTTVGWTYNSTDRTVDFDEEHVPGGGSLIEIEYAVVGDCEG